MAAEGTSQSLQMLVGLGLSLSRQQLPGYLLCGKGGKAPSGSGFVARRKALSVLCDSGFVSHLHPKYSNCQVRNGPGGCDRPWGS